eukprot:m.166034 g.166034  ORF g.166034 m.166034 type:complete len:825 (-) comp14698_c0_seq2:123-2597(-)
MKTTMVLAVSLLPALAYSSAVPRQIDDGMSTTILPCENAVRPIVSDRGFQVSKTLEMGYWLRPCDDTGRCYERTMCFGDPDWAAAHPDAFVGNYFGDKACREFRDGCQPHVNSAGVLERCIELLPCNTAPVTRSPITRSPFTRAPSVRPTFITRPPFTHAPTGRPTFGTRPPVFTFPPVTLFTRPPTASTPCDGATIPTWSTRGVQVAATRGLGYWLRPVRCPDAGTTCYERVRCMGNWTSAETPAGTYLNNFFGDRQCRVNRGQCDLTTITLDLNRVGLDFDTISLRPCLSERPCSSATPAPTFPTRPPTTRSPTTTAPSSPTKSCESAVWPHWNDRGLSAEITLGHGWFLRPCPHARNCYEPTRCHGRITGVAAYRGNWFGDAQCRVLHGGCQATYSAIVNASRRNCIDFTQCLTPGTQSPTPQPTTCICPDIYRPVCAGGTTYANACEVRCAGHTDWVSGPCPTRAPVAAPTQPPTCAPGTPPVLCIARPCDVSPCPLAPRGSTCVDNYCGGCNAEWYAPNGTRIEECTLAPTTAPSICICPDIYDPVCADGTTYSNRCQARCAGHQSWVNGPCRTLPPASQPTDCVCPRVYDPVCVDGQTYSNACEARCAGHTTWIDGPCTTPPRPTRSPTRCLCTAVYNPVCAGGRTYGNPCRADCAGYVQWTDGPCRTAAPSDRPSWTFSPTTAAPVTVAPTTHAPVTVAPTTHAPTTPSRNGPIRDIVIPGNLRPVVTRTTQVPRTTAVTTRAAISASQSSGSSSTTTTESSFAGAMVGVALLVIAVLLVVLIVVVRMRPERQHSYPGAPSPNNEMEWDQAVDHSAA